MNRVSKKFLCAHESKSRRTVLRWVALGLKTYFGRDMSGDNRLSRGKYYL
jgi:hypothetical protein